MTNLLVFVSYQVYVCISYVQLGLKGNKEHITVDVVLIELNQVETNNVVSFVSQEVENAVLLVKNNTFDFLNTELLIKVYAFLFFDVHEYCLFVWSHNEDVLLLVGYEESRLILEWVWNLVNYWDLLLLEI